MSTTVIVLIGIAVVVALAWLPIFMPRPRSVKIIGDEERYSKDGLARSVHKASVKTKVDPDFLLTPTGLEQLARSYWTFLARTSFGLVHVRYRPDGRDLRLGFITLLSFKAPEYILSKKEGVIMWSISGGLLAKHHTGSLKIKVRPSGNGWARVQVRVHSFHPALPHWIYDHTQALLHGILTRAFLRSIAYRSLSVSRVKRFA